MPRIALIGNPNVGKSVIFNELTGLNQTIANFPGCTVEKKEGEMRYEEKSIEVIDLPGIYSLSPHSIDEQISREYIIEENPDLILVVLDASNLERNLYLTVQLMELNVHLLIVLNMIDLAKGKGIVIDSNKLSRKLGIPIIETIATKGIGIHELKSKICEMLTAPNVSESIIWNKRVTDAIDQILNYIEPYSSRIEKRFPLKWIATLLLESDEYAWQILEHLGILREELEPKIMKLIDEKLAGDGIVSLVDARYEIATEIISDVQQKYSGRRWALSEMLDEVLTNRFLGIPIFLSIMWGVFQLTFIIGEPLVALIELGFTKLGDLVYIITNLLDGVGNGINPISNFFVGAIIDGVGSVLVFLPYIVLLFIAMAILEDTGYLSRVAYLMDRFMSRIGLHGHSIIPLLLGFGCNVPAVMATRAIKNDNDRKTTIMINSFMSCSARLPIYILIAGTIFPVYAGLVTLSLYVLGILVGILFAWLFRKTLFRGEKSELIIELQPFTSPTPKSVFIKMWNQTKEFLKKASTIIFVAVAIIYLLNESGIMEYLGRGVAYLFWWMKISDGSSIGWEYGAALLSGLVAKEVIIGTLGTLLGFGSTNPSDPSLQGTIGLLGPAAGIGYLVFILLYAPCIATLAVIKHETKSWKWMLFSLAFTSIVAYAFSALFYFLTKLIIGV
ncbi:MAG TPA: ferrous iron transport protein B [candidate division Zixibacteria bacterium]|nr:ferrous iron transport protein B [candidate division Zixibacteria bacterium]